MKAAKDNFSALAKGYSKYRPDYPQTLYDHLYTHCGAFEQVWDCATGNGQVALSLSTQFKNVYASDLSEAQIAQAAQADNIHYSVQRAESTNFPDDFFDLITVGQAYHWFDFEAFGKEANRVLKPGGLVAIWSYHLMRTHPEFDQHIDDFYLNVVGPYWDEERNWVDKRYEDVPFHFDPVPTDFTFPIVKEFNLADLEGYMNTWSAVRHFKNQRGFNPVDDFIQKVATLWSGSVKVTFPGFVKLGRKNVS